MKLGIVLSSNEAEVAWNAFRLGNTALKAGHEASVFLINAGVEAEDSGDEKHNVKAQAGTFSNAGGRILACGTCLKARQKQKTNTCPISSMADLLKLVEDSDKIVSFG